MILPPLNDQDGVLFGCVAENNPRYLSQALRLLYSIRFFCGQLADADVMICVVDKVDSGYKARFKKLGAIIRIVDRFNPRHPHSNKIQFLMQPEIMDYKTIVLLDCDTLVVQDPSPLIDPVAFQAKIAALPTVPHEIFIHLFKYFGIDLPPRKYSCTFSGTRTIWYCNSGVLILPTVLIKGIVEKWSDYNRRLSNNLSLLEAHQNFCDQASLSLAFTADPVPFKPLPVRMNCQLNLPYLPFITSMDRCDPVILHYHDHVDMFGYLMSSHYPGVQKRIKLFNDFMYQALNQDMH